MGILSGLLGNASQADVEDVEKNLVNVLADGEQVDRAFQLIRDMLIFTRTRLLIVDKQGMTGKKTEYHSIPYRAITHYSVETAGHFDLESELRIWVSGSSDPIQHTFKAGDAIIAVQKALATYVK
ncbi:MAG TPA: PH domain-containing protein [Thermoanaerobaculia bacterium]|jgi:PH (Pleckstrin Homology) domain-containing protein